VDQWTPGNPWLEGGHADAGPVAILPAGAIPPIDTPRFESPATARVWLGGRAPVIVVRVGGDVRAYPSAILQWHEVVNDVVGGRPLLISFCPLCNTAVAYERSFGGAAHLFEVSGQLDAGAAVLLDRATGSTYTQPTGEQLGGPREVSALRWYPSDLLPLDEATAAYPQLRVLSRPAGTDHDYGTTLYSGVDSAGRPLGSNGFLDTRVPVKTRIVGVAVAQAARAWRYDRLAALGVLNDRVGASPVVVIFRPATASIGDEGSLSGARAVGSAGVFDPRVAGRVLHLRKTGQTLTDGETSSTWNLAGVATAGPLTGTHLRIVRHIDTYWFAWTAFYAQTSLWPATPAGPCSVPAR
jgi:hypothetical protein